ncbi:HAD family hydrolase [Aurantiacibacter luteus]|uniref:Hydrolase n=1 Tax=Aurantiacibacter luteus TaxID=1581420 RepID=A0A0G9MTJ6_9SPHN|nr:HAD family phosphatase [Aurantiacibacter luteus]KLE34051.1 hydrolase [Aurantiacibacter luteus]
MSDARAEMAVVFDVGRVLIRWDLRCLFAKMIDDPAELEWFVTHVVTEEWHFQHDAGRPLAEMVPERIAEFPAYERQIAAYATRFNETIPGPVPGSHELVRRLHAGGIPLFALTNFGAEFWNAFRPTEPLFDLFEDIVVSGVEKCAKPDPRIYAIAEARFGLPPERLLFVDDRAENVAAAEARGWHGHVFTDAGRLETDLAARGLLAI